MSVIDLMTAKMKLLRIMTNTSPHFHLNFLMFDVAMKSNEQAEILLLQRTFSSRRLGFTGMQQQQLCIRHQKILLAREKSLSDFQ